MATNTERNPKMTWLIFALLTVGCWGVYGVLLHSGQMSMSDPENGRYKAFLWVGIAYFLAAVLAPLAMLLVRGASWQMPAGGVGWSLLAGIAGAIGAFGVLLAFEAKGSPAAVMSIIFAGAPIVNAAVALTLSSAWSHVRLPFIVGIVLAAAGGYLVTLYKPTVPHKAPPSAAQATDHR